MIMARLHFRSVPLSLRARFTLGLGAVLLPFLLAIIVGQFYLLPRIIEPLEDIVRKSSEEIVLMELQIALLQAAMPVNDHLIHGDPDGRRQFAQRHQRVERAFGEASPKQFTLAEKHAFIGTARAEWLQAQCLGEELLRLPKPGGNVAAARDMEQFNAHITLAVSALDEAHDHFSQVFDRNRTQTGAARIKVMWVAFAVLVLAPAASLFAGVVLARSVTRPIDTLRQGAVHLAEGKLSHRVAIRRNDELGTLATAFNEMAGQLETSQAALYELATHDGLTGLYNHRTFYTLLTDELARAQRFKRPVSLLMLDIDHFKCVNDTHGHQAGDAILKGLSELLGWQMRTVDRVCRYGGEEIAVILPETDFDTAANIAERLRASVETQPFDVNTGTPVRITISIGVMSWPVQGGGADMLVAAADAALYAAKRSGRNRISRYEPALDESGTNT